MTTSPRFYQSGGQLFADRRPVSLEWATDKLNEWLALEYRLRIAGDDLRADEVNRQVEALEAATKETWRWLRASGPNAAEAYTQKVREMLSASLEQGGAA